MRRIFGIVCSVVLLSFTFTACSGSLGAGLIGKGYDMAKISKSVINANSEFAFDIFKQLNTEDADKNIFISPLSISTALTMTYNGAESTTKKAMGEVLGFRDMDINAVNESYNNLLNYLKNVDKKVDLSIANSIWVRQGEEIQAGFLSNNQSQFNAKIAALDFSKDDAANTINQWISNATKSKIDKMLEPPIDSSVIMYLINAIYFKGEWSDQFNPKNTFDHIFKTFDGKEQTVRMMSRKGKVQYAKGDNYKAVKLPYGKGKTSAYFILPDDGIHMNEFIGNISITQWNDIRNNMSEVDEMILQIPKFKMEYGIKNLNDSLQSLGMGEAFGDRADFSGIREGVYISQVLHKAVIEVNEKGSKAAAATVVAMNKGAAVEPITFIADRPFIFFIADDITGTILFMGKLLSVES